MMTTIRRATTCLALALCATPAWAQTPMPEDLHGIWALGACENPDELLINAAGGAVYLSFTQDFAVTTTFLGIEPTGEGWYGFRELVETPAGTYDFFARVDGDALEEIWPAMEPVASPDAVPADGERYTYQRCAQMPALYALAFGEGLAFTAAIGEIGPSCRAATMETCIRGFFDLADLTGDDAVSAAELTRLTRMYVQHAQLHEGVVISDFATMQAATTVLGALLGEALVTAFDYDASGQLSFDEVMAGRASGMLDPAMLTAMDWYQDGIDFAAAAEALNLLMQDVALPFPLGR